MGDNTVPTIGLLNFLTALIGTALVGVNGAKITLFTNDVNPGKGATIGDFTLATFNGSALKAITWLGAFANSNGDAETLSGLETFSTDGVIPETVYGIVIVDGVAPTLLRWYARFDAPIALTTAGQLISLVARLVMSAGGFGASVQVAP